MVSTNSTQYAFYEAWYPRKSIGFKIPLTAYYFIECNKKNMPTKFIFFEEKT